MGAVISEETAGETVARMLDYYEIDVSAMPEILQNAINASLKKIREAIMVGRLEIEIDDETIRLVQILSKPPKGFPGPLVYKEVTGQAKIGIRDDSGDYGKMYNFLGALTGEGVGVIQKLRGKDLSLAEALGAVFLQV